MKISVIIPHRNRQKRLALCLESVKRSAEESGANIDVLVAEHNKVSVWQYGPNHTEPVKTAHRCEHPPMPVFNKGLLQNSAIEIADGDIIAFLDADAIVGRNWVGGMLLFFAVNPDVTRLCWRVRYLPEHYVELLSAESPTERIVTIDGLFDNYDTYPRAFEAYDDPLSGKAVDGRIVFGNSQFAMRRDILGDMRYDEKYVGRGMEDLSFIREIWYRYGRDYRGVIVTDGPQAMFHIANQNTEDWFNRPYHERNIDRYFAQAKPDLEMELRA